MDCIPKKVVSQVVKAALERARLSKATRDAVSQDVDDQVAAAKVIHGRVASMTIEPSGFQAVSVIAPDGSADFLFGQNDRGLLPEFARAQAHSCGVSVFYSQAPGTFALITVLNVYSPSDPSTPVSNILTWPLPSP